MAVIRALRTPDLAGLLELLEPLAGSAYPGTAADLAHALSGLGTGTAAAVLTLDGTDQVRGVAVLATADPQACELLALWVDPAFRRRGLARAMLSAFTPVWAAATITAVVPPGADPDPVGALLSQFAFTRTADPPLGGGQLWRTRRVRRTTGRASLTPAG